MSTLNVRDCFIASSVDLILEKYGIDNERYQEYLSDYDEMEALEELIADSHLSYVLVSVTETPGGYRVVIADAPSKMSPQIEQRMRNRKDMAESYIKNPTDFQWDVLSKHIMQNELGIPQRLASILELCGIYDEDVEEQVLRETLDDVRTKLGKMLKSIQNVEPV